MWTDGICVRWLQRSKCKCLSGFDRCHDCVILRWKASFFIQKYLYHGIILCGFRMINDSSSLAHVIHLRKWRLMNANGHMVHEDASVCKWCKSFCVCSVWTPCPCDSLFMWDFNTIVHTFFWSVVKRRPWQHFSEGLVSSYISDVCVKQWVKSDSFTCIQHFIF